MKPVPRSSRAKANQNTPWRSVCLRQGVLIGYVFVRAFKAAAPARFTAGCGTIP